MNKIPIKYRRSTSKPPKISSNLNFPQPSQIMEELLKQTPKIKPKYAPKSSAKNTKKKTRSSSCNGKQPCKKQQYFLDKIKEMKKNIQNDSLYPTPELTPLISQTFDEKMTFQVLNRQSEEKVNKIKAHLKQSTNKLNSIKKESDDYILEEISKGNSKLLKQVAEFERRSENNAEQFNQKMKKYLQDNEIINKNYTKEIKHLQLSLYHEREERKLQQDKLAHLQTQMQLLQDKLKAKDERPEVKENQPRSERKDFAYYEKQVKKLKSIIKEKQQTIRDCENEKNYIRKNATEVLDFLHSEFPLSVKFNTYVEDVKKFK